jgi:Ran GTPase-activating protein (RanGAP) involved in mRNA processing and transport
MHTTNLKQLIHTIEQGSSTLNCSDADLSSLELEQLMQALSKSNQIEVIDLSFQPINEPVLRALHDGVKQQPLKILTIKNAALSATLATPLAEIIACSAHLEQLDLSDNLLSDNGIQFLAPGLTANQSLKTIDLTRNGISDEGAKTIAYIIAQHPAVMNVNLFDNKIGDEGAAALAHHAPLSQTLRSLGLSLNKIGDKGAHALAQAIKKSDTLHSLYLASNFFGEQAMRHLEEAMHQHPSMEKLFLLLRQGRLANKLRKFRDLLE